MHLLDYIVVAFMLIAAIPAYFFIKYNEPPACNKFRHIKQALKDAGFID